MILQAKNAIRYNGELLRTGSVFEVDAKTAKRLIAREVATPHAGPVNKLAEKRANARSLLREISQGRGNKKLVVT